MTQLYILLGLSVGGAVGVAGAVLGVTALSNAGTFVQAAWADHGAQRRVVFLLVSLPVMCGFGAYLGFKVWDRFIAQIARGQSKAVPELPESFVAMARLQIILLPILGIALTISLTMLLVLWHTSAAGVLQELNKLQAPPRIFAAVAILLGAFSGATTGACLAYHLRWH